MTEFKLSVNANFKDENGGNVYAVLFFDEVDTDQLKLSMRGNFEYATQMSPSISDDNSQTSLDADILLSFANSCSS